MPETNAIIQLLTKDAAWHATNATLKLGAGRVIFQSGVNPMISKVGDGVTELQNLKWRETGFALTGLVAGANTTILETDTLLEALQKLQAQIDTLKSTAFQNF